MPPARLGTSTKFPDCWPIGAEFPAWAAPKKNVVWKMGTFETVPIHLATPPDTYPADLQRHGGIKMGAAALVGAVAGALGGATWVTRSASRAAKRRAERIEAARKNSKRTRRKKSQSTRKRTDVAITRRELISTSPRPECRRPWP
jgi:hypothetical protein